MPPRRTTKTPSSSHIAPSFPVRPNSFSSISGTVQLGTNTSHLLYYSQTSFCLTKLPLLYTSSHTMQNVFEVDPIPTVKRES